MNHVLSSEELQLQTDMLETLAEHAQPHIARDPRLSLLPLDDPANHPGQGLYEFYVASKPTTPDGIDYLASMVMANYDEVSEDLQHGEQSAQLREAGDFLKSGGSVLLATSHEGLIDPGIVVGTVASPLRKQGYKFASGLGLFKMLPILQFKFKPEMPPAPCMGVIGQICDVAYLAITRSETVRDSGLLERNPIMPTFTDYNNASVKYSAGARQTGGNFMLAEAPSASTHKWNDDRTKCVIPRVTPGTAKMMVHPNTRVLPVNFDLDANNNAYLEIRGGLRKLEDLEEAHEVMEDMAQGFNDRSAATGNGRPYEYAQAA